MIVAVETGCGGEAQGHAVRADDTQAAPIGNRDAAPRFDLQARLEAGASGIRASS